MIDGQLVTLLDTPGFDDSGRDDAEILQYIGLHLKAAYDNNILLRGVVYLHRITDNYLRGSSLRSLRILKELCGHKYYYNIALVTTMWSEIADPKEGEKREKELMTNSDYWKVLIAAGAKVYRHDEQAKSAKHIVRELLGKQDIPTQFQEELEIGGVIAKTSAGALVADHLERMQKKHETEISELRKQIADLVLKKEEDEREEIEKMKEDMKKLEAARAKAARGDIDKMTEDMNRLRLPVDAIEDTRLKEFQSSRKAVKIKPGWNRCVTQ